MKRIRAEGLDLWYFAAGDDPRRVSEVGLNVPPPEPFMERALQETPNIRMVVVPTRPGSDHAGIYYLYFDDAPDLNELDRRVERGTATNEDFAPSIVTRYQKTLCRRCGHSWHTLVVPPDTYIGLGDLHRRKMEPRWKDVKTCPTCKASFGQIVLHIFGSADPSLPSA